MRQTHTRHLSPRRALSARMNEALVAYDRTVLRHAEATLLQIARALDGREESKTST